MAATKRNAMTVPKARDELRATQLMNRLTDHGLGKLQKPLEATQVQAINIVLKKLKPDLQAVAVQGNIDGKFSISWES